MDPIPFHRPSAAPGEAVLVAQALGGQRCGDGPFSRNCCRMLEQLVGVPRALLTTSCSDALEMAAILLGCQGGEVIVPSFTFVTTAGAFVLHGATPIFADVRPDTLNIDDRQLEALITPRTRAIVVVHYAGVACAMDEILAIAARHGVAVVEDNAHGLFASYRGRQLGTLGALATLSFHETKNISCGEGGALLINDRALIGRAEIIREKGTNRAQFFRGEVAKYSWVDAGASFLSSDILAAVLQAQLEHQAVSQARRLAIWQAYQTGLTAWAVAQGVQLPVIPAGCGHPAHMFHLLLPDLAARQAFIAQLKTAGIQASFHYQPLHGSEMGIRLGGRPGQCPVTEDIADRLVRLPLYPDLSEAQQARVIAAVQAFRS